MADRFDIVCDSCSQVALTLRAVSAERVDGVPGTCSGCNEPGFVRFGDDGQNPYLTFEVVIDYLQIVADYFRFSTMQLVGRDRHRNVTRARHVAMYLMRERRKLSFPKLGKIFGERDHTTIMHGVRDIAEALLNDEELQRQLKTIESRIFDREGPLVMVTRTPGEGAWLEESDSRIDLADGSGQCAGAQDP